MKNHSFDSCKICGAKTEKKYRIIWNGIGHNIQKCEKCDFHFIDYLDHASFSVEVPEKISDDEFQYIEKLLQSNEERFHWQSELVCSYIGSQSPRVLDIGAGGGKFLASMRERGAVAMGIEPNGVRVRFARDRYQLEIDQRLIDDGYWQKDHSASFQAVSLWDVVEHVDDPKKLLEDAVNMLSPGGYLFIDTPTRESFYYRLGELSYGLSGGRQPLFLRSIYSPAPYAHKQIFTQKQLAALLEGMGMNVRQLESFHELSFPYSFYLRKLVKSQTLADMLAPLASAFFVVFRIRNKMLAVARKDEPSAKSGNI